MSAKDERIYKVKSIGGFRDGMAFPRYISPGEVLHVTGSELRRMKNSGGEFEELGWFPPPSIKAEDPAPEKDEGGEEDCTAVKANGEPCTLSAKEDGLCHIHLRGRK